MNDTHKPMNRPVKYKIIIAGHLKEKWAEWLNGMVIGIENKEDGSHHTTITVAVPDQAALRGILNKLWDLNLTLISVIQWNKEP